MIKCHVTEETEEEGKETEEETEQAGEEEETGDEQEEEVEEEAEKEVCPVRSQCPSVLSLGSIHMLDSVSR